MKKDGSCDTTTVQSVIYSIAFHAGENRKTIIIKSTVPPGTTEKLNEEYPLFDIVFNPEFLTEANFIEDFKNQDRIIIGGPRPATTKVRQLFSKAFPQVHIIKTSSTIAEMVKYMTNTFLATKVSFANEIYQICERLGVDYDKVVEYSTLDERLGKSHWAVPGPDGKLGFGGSCFPKDINALISVADELGVGAWVLRSAWDTNLDVRPEEDWKELIGRAITDESEKN
tara:strand:- start:736 stop:1416 length:681 start_codon:yes stop_codon:yes gene_type:complete